MKVTILNMPSGNTKAFTQGGAVVLEVRFYNEWHHLPDDKKTQICEAAVRALHAMDWRPVDPEA